MVSKMIETLNNILNVQTHVKIEAIFTSARRDASKVALLPGAEFAQLQGHGHELEAQLVRTFKHGMVPLSLGLFKEACP